MNISFKNWCKAAKSKQYGYSIEPDTEHETVSLIINSTSMSELDGEEEGVLFDGSYMGNAEIMEDIKAAEDIYNITFDLI